jgi:carboxypeptidase C (cathepsin A)
VRLQRGRAGGLALIIALQTIVNRLLNAKWRLFAVQMRFSVGPTNLYNEGIMKRVLAASGIVLFWFAALCASARAQAPEKAAKAPEAKTAEQKAPPKETSSVTEHSIQLDGQNVPYKATAGTILIKDEKGNPTASIFYTAYTRRVSQDMSHRPLMFVYNGGPGGSSAPQHMGAFGPKRVVTLDAEPTPPPPYKVVDNAYSLLDVTDLVYIDPVGTGFSHAVGKAKDKDFWGVDSDVKSLAQFINSYVNRNNRWNSPKFLLGESYGTFRNAALVDYLQSHDGMDFNGVVMMSTVLDLGTISFHPGEDMTYVYYLPSYAAVAWYHKILKNRPADLNSFLEQARQFAITEYADALMKGSQLGATERADVLKELSGFTGLSEDYLDKADLRVKLSQFMDELQRARGLTTGRLDARFSGPTFDLLGEYAEYDPLETAVFGAFVASFNQYVREDLKYGKNQHYVLLNGQAARSWNWKHSIGRGFGFPGSPNVEADLRDAMIGNPHLKIQVENGYYDLATPFFATEHTMDHLDLPADRGRNIQMEYYRAGHMMYLHVPSLQRLKTNVAAFVRSASGE